MNFEVNADICFDDDVELTSETDKGGIIIPKQTCEHVQHVHLTKVLNYTSKNQCIDCESTIENWLCLSCGEIHCSRYINNHGEEHWLFTLLTDELDNIGHCLTISLQDLSVWCFPCESYIKNIRINPLIKQLELIKFGSSSTNQYVNQSHTNSIDNLVVKNIVDNPSTIIAIQDPLLLEELEKTDLLSYCYTIKVRPASIDELVCLHSSDYVNTIVLAEKNHVNLSNNHFHIKYDNDTTFFNARSSAGIAIDVINNVLNNQVHGFILVTSPGHRAVRAHGYGTSIYNNVALGINAVLMQKVKPSSRKNSLTLVDSPNYLDIQGASPVESAICHMIHVLTPASNADNRRHSRVQPITDKNNNKIQVQRVIIIDLSYEHGCGSQSIYYESDQVFYISIHNEDEHHKSSYNECGKKDGLGYTMNIPLSSIDKVNDNDYIAILNELILPITKDFKPELIVICVDFHMKHLSELCYAYIIEQLSTICKSKLVVALDGDLSSISARTNYVQTVLSVLIGKLSLSNSDKWKNKSNISDDVRQKIDHVKKKHKHYWPCFE